MDVWVACSHPTPVLSIARYPKRLSLLYLYPNLLSTHLDSTNPFFPLPHSDSALMDPPPRKRRRAALSCLDCKRRKLKCDRTYPCSRCQKRGHPQTCTYENALLGPGESLVDGFPKILANSTCAPGDLPEPMPRPGHTDGSHNTSNTSASDPGALHEAASRSAHIESSGGLSFTVQAQADRILQLENRVIGLEGIMVRHPTGPAGAQGWDRKLLAHQSALDPSVLSTSSTLYQEVAWKEPVDLGLMHLRGKNFKTQFYGASHPTSLITQVPSVPFFYSCELTKSSP